MLEIVEDFKQFQLSNKLVMDSLVFAHDTLHGVVLLITSSKRVRYFVEALANFALGFNACLQSGL